MSINYEMASMILDAAVRNGRRQDMHVAAVVCDLAGHAVATARDEKAGSINLTAAASKASTAVNFGATGRELLESVRPDALLFDSVIATKPVSLLPGGIPIHLGDRIVGGLGIAGGHYSQDHTIAQQALADWARASGQAGASGQHHRRRVIITGARGGIGLLACERFAETGATVIGLDRHADEGGELAKAYRARGLDIRFETLDVSDVAAIDRFAKSFEHMFGYADVLVNNAGVLSFSPLMQTDLAEWEKVQNINCRSAFLMMKSLVPLMGSAGVVLNMSSSAALFPTANSAAYSVAKMGVVTLSKIAALEMGPGVRVVAVCPGPLDTPMPHNYLRGHPKEKEIMEEMIGRTIVKRLGRPEEIADLLLFLASEKSGFITGSVISADGGFIG